MKRGLVIHIVDDDAPVRSALQFALEAVGLEVESYLDASDFRAREPAARGLMICDVRMPGISGIALARLIRQDGSTMPIILMTGHANPALQSEAIAAGANVVLEKPVSLPTLLAEITRLTAHDEG